MVERDERGNSLIVVVVGILLIIFGAIVEILTISGVFEKALNLEILSAFNVYVVGTVIAIVLVVFGVLILIFGLR
ncbi:MAG: hypothetical protein QXN36_00155 [Candidatus Bathyarchaeia archaeon]